MSRPRKYTPNTLKKAVNGYFDSISRLVPLTEKRNTGRKDSDGHVIYEEVPVLNRLGVQATVDAPETVYFIRHEFKRLE